MSVTMPRTETSMRLPLGDLIRELAQKTQELIVKQVELTKTELKVEGQKLAKISAFAVVALHLSAMFVFLLGVSLVLVLDQWISLLWAVIATTFIFLAGTGLLLGLIVKEAQKAFPPVEE